MCQKPCPSSFTKQYAYIWYTTLCCNRRIAMLNDNLVVSILQVLFEQSSRRQFKGCGEWQLLIFETTEIGAKDGVEPVEESPIVARMCIVEFAVLHPGGASADEIIRDPARIDKALQKAF